jgi:DNA ligase-1
MGRSTLKEQYLVKLARFETAEATIIGYEEQMANTNSEKRNAVGSMDRASFKAGLVPKGTLGALVVVDCKSGVEFKIGTGFTDIQRRDFWNNREHFIGSTIVYRCKRHGEKIKPRCPTYKGFRKEGF